MPRAYTIATAALALDMPVKWLDNVLSHNRVHGIHQERQGVARRLTIEGLLVLTIATLLIKELGVSLAPALELAQEMAINDGLHTSPAGVRIQLDLEVLKDRLLESLANAVEIAPSPKRGRPAKNKTGRLE
jgi:hypothetical protein